MCICVCLGTLCNLYVDVSNLCLCAFMASISLEAPKNRILLLLPWHCPLRVLVLCWLIEPNHLCRAGVGGYRALLLFCIHPSFLQGLKYGLLQSGGARPMPLFYLYHAETPLYLTPYTRIIAVLPPPYPFVLSSVPLLSAIPGLS